MNRKLRVSFYCILTLVITICVLAYLTSLFERKSAYEKYEQFFEMNGDVDALLIGTSHVINGIFPLELWEDYGITSYNFGGHSNAMATNYWVMMNALDYSSPKMVVIDCHGLGENTKSSDIFSFLHLSFDAFPLSINKVKAVWDLLDDPYMDEAIADGLVRESDEPRTRIGLLWDYSVYHNRWSELTGKDFNPDASLLMGADHRSGIKSGELVKIDHDQKISGDDVSTRYLRRMIEECQRRGIGVLLVYIPYPDEGIGQCAANYVYDLAEEYNVRYLNYFDMDVVDYSTDFFDETHLNPCGARKITNSVGNELRYDGLCDHRQEEKYRGWWTNLYWYYGMKNDELASADEMLEYLMLLNGDNLGITVEVYDEQIYSDSRVVSLLDGIQKTRDWTTGKIGYVVNKYEHSLENKDLESQGAIHIIVTREGNIINDRWF